nr:zinc finger, CCHC-type [Tanacetum cinerariifolium]
MTDSRPVMEQYNELLGIPGRFTQHKMNMDEAIQVSCIIDKLPSSWKDFKHTLKHKKEELTLVDLGNHLCIKESLKVHTKMEMEMEMPYSSRVKFITSCSYLTNTYVEIMKVQVKVSMLPQTLISTSS